MARVENALVREFNQDGPSELTQQDNDALSMSCIMMMKGSFDLNIIPNPSAYIPTLDQMLRYNGENHCNIRSKFNDVCYSMHKYDLTYQTIYLEMPFQADEGGYLRISIVKCPYIYKILPNKHRNFTLSSIPLLLHNLRRRC